MKISTKGRYALRFMIDLAEHNNGGYTALRDVTERQGISIKYLEQIVSQLYKVGYIKSFRGAQGGYKLAKDPEEYTAGDILRVTEGDLTPVSCLENTPVECQRAAECKTLDFWRGLYGVINAYIDSVTLADLTAAGSGYDFVI